MIINDYVLMELDQQRRAQVADSIAALRVAKDRRRSRVSLFRRRTRTARTNQPVTNTVAFGTGSATQ